MLKTASALRPLLRRRPEGTRPTYLAEADALSTLQRPIHDVVRPFFIPVVHRAAQAARTPPELVYQETRAALAETKRRLEKLSLPQTDVEDIHYALVAFTDEAMQQQPGPLAQFWGAHLLQLELYGETRAGEGFYQRLQRAKADERLGVLRVYQLCLLFGFYGIYAQHGELERENLLEELRNALGDGSPDAAFTLSPHGRRPDEPVLDRVRNRLLISLAAAAAVCSIAWYVGIAFTLDARASALRESVQQADEDLKVGIMAGGE